MKIRISFVLVFFFVLFYSFESYATVKEINETSVEKEFNKKNKVYVKEAQKESPNKIKKKEKRKERLLEKLSKRAKLGFGAAVLSVFAFYLNPIISLVFSFIGICICSGAIRELKKSGKIDKKLKRRLISNLILNLLSFSINLLLYIIIFALLL